MPESSHELIDQTGLADARFAFDEHDLPIARLGLLVEGMEPAKIVVPAVERRFPRDADAAERALGLEAERLGTLPPPVALLPLLQHLQQLGRRGKPLARILRRQRVDDLLDEGRQLGIHLPRPARLGLDHVPKRRGGVVGPVRMLPRRELVEHHPESVEVGSAVHLRATGLELLGRGVLQGADERSGLGEPDGFVLQSSHAEVHHLDDVLLGDEHVLGLQVAVDDARCVDGDEALRDLPADVAAEFLGDANQLA